MKLFSAFLLLFAANGVALGQHLPATFVPSHYRLLIDPNIAEQHFTGEETIEGNLVQSANEIVLNALDLKVTAAEVTEGSNTQPAQVTYDQAAETIRLSIPSELDAGSATIHLKWAGKLTDGLRGLYLSRTPRRTYAVTQFEGTYARRMFPSFDEPGFKATFDLTVIADKQDTVISNGRILNDTPLGDAGRHALVFSTSPRMSTYLVAVAIGDWQCLERTVDGTPIRVCAVPENRDKGRFALDVAARSIQFYDQWYGIPYPFGKLDMLAIPDYEWGGMENTASIFYRDTALLLDESAASVFALRGHATIIAHEIAHQWFGDLVTAAWWDDIWLNEGFATWMSAKPIAAWHPEWRLEDDVAVTTERIISLDSLAASRAIHGDPKTPAEIKEMFDGITYQKGAAVLSMLESYVGPEVFRQGVNAYLKAHANGNATSADFWQAEAEASGKPIDQVMPTFVLQPGVPMLSVNSACNGGKQQTEFAQQRFFLSAERLRGGSPQQWQIPVCTRSATANTCTLMTTKTQQATGDACSSWLFANRDAKGYFRAAYAPADLKAVAAVAEQSLNPPERIALVEDSWAMTRVGKTSVGDFLDLVLSMRSERDLAAVNLLADDLTDIGSTLVPDKESSAYQKFVRRQFAANAAELGWAPRAGDSDEQKAMRASLLGILGRAGDPGAIAAARTMVRQFMHDPASVDATMAVPAFDTTAAQGDPALYEQMEGALGKAKSADDYSAYLFALAAFRSPGLAQRTLSLVDQGKIRQQLYPQLFSALLDNPAAQDAAWGYLKLHWSDLAEKVTSFGGRGAVTALGSFCTTEKHNDVEQFFHQHPAPGAERAVSQSLERMENCVSFRNLQQQNLESWLVK